ncbi:penicillin-binding transpeptidase domain-containing protein [Vallitalea okinawensis]|uniref:penicillin-binding transpeptidase domain-containing protein n=1 Tax=Vallitalea okinawensis TaxID=2078660 RepID=UPI000CFD693C|nr:penicillin-binding transpeptidase domain-containing protein [Vallitalea okinawensis]
MKPIFKKIIEIITNRVFILGVFIVFLFCVLVVRTFYLQIVKGEEFIITESYNQREVETNGIRGNIYDVNGRPLAINDYVYSIMFMPEEASELTHEEMNNNIHELINVIEDQGDNIDYTIPLVYRNGQILYDESFSESQIRRFKKDVFKDETLGDEQVDMNPQDLYGYIRDELFYINPTMSIENTLNIMNIRYNIFMNRYRSYQPITIADDVNEDTIVLVKEHQDEFPGVFVTTNTVRIYPYGETVAHMVGYTGSMTDDLLEDLAKLGYDQFDQVGRSGIEKEMEIYLQGNKGKKVYEVDNTGKIISQTVLEDPTQGDNVYLTIDAELQEDIYQLIEKQLVSVLLDKIVLNPTKDGEYGVNDVLFATINNYMIDINQLGNPDLYYSNVLLNAYKNLEEEFVQTYNALLFSDTLIKDYNELNQEFYIEMAQRMKINKHFKYNYELGYYLYQSQDDEVYEIYKNYEITALDFIEHCVKNDYIDLSVYDDLPKDAREIARKIVEAEFKDFIKTETFQFKIYEYLIQNNYIGDTQFLMVLYEQGILTGTDEEVTAVQNGNINPLTVIETKLNEGQITPRQLGLDPSTGSVVVTDVNTGEVISLVSYPSYDNNLIMNDSDYRSLIYKDKTKPLYYRATQQRVVPGSTFKMLTAMTALEEGVITPSEQIYATGTYKNVGIVKPPSCWAVGYGYVHGNTDVSRAIEVSCNYYFSEIAYRLGSLGDNRFDHIVGINYMEEYMHYFGLDAPTGVELVENTSLMDSIDAIRAAFGNNRDEFTASQLARYTSSLANGGTTYDLYLVDSVMTQEGRSIEDKEPKIYYQNSFQEENLLAVQKGMHDVTAGSNGTVRTVFEDMPINVAGKTGTAQNSHGDGFDHGLFVGYAPYEQPQIAVSVILPYSGGSADAALLFKEVTKTYFDFNKEEEDGSIDNIFVY